MAQVVRPSEAKKSLNPRLGIPALAARYARWIARAGHSITHFGSCGSKRAKIGAFWDLQPYLLTFFFENVSRYGSKDPKVGFERLFGSKWFFFLGILGLKCAIKGLE